MKSESLLSRTGTGAPGGEAAQPRGAAAAAGGQGLGQGRGDVVGPVGPVGEGAVPRIPAAQGPPRLGAAGREEQRRQVGSAGLCRPPLRRPPPRGPFSLPTPPV